MVSYETFGKYLCEVRHFLFAVDVKKSTLQIFENLRITHAAELVAVKEIILWKSIEIWISFSSRIVISGPIRYS